jgi:hypothetical protein
MPYYALQLARLSLACVAPVLGPAISPEPVLVQAGRRRRWDPQAAINQASREPAQPRLRVPLTLLI